jgi:endo-1,4-beta-xylanase
VPDFSRSGPAHCQNPPRLEEEAAGLFTRRTANRLKLTLLVAAVVASLSGAGLAPAAPSGMRLRDLAGTFLIGFAAKNNFWKLSDAAAYKSTAAAQFNVLTPENEMKFDLVHPEQSTYTFARADKHVKFARRNKLRVHGHALIWHERLPAWLTDTSWTAAELTNVMEDHIATVVGHFRGRVAIWDVVNEAFNDGGTRRATIWQNTIGPGYIERAFLSARAADPSAALVYNDFGIETPNAKSNAVYAMISDFKRRGVPVDGIGFQMHLNSVGINLASLSSNMQRFADLGVKIYITEMDVRLPVPATTSALQNQAAIYRNVLDRCLLQPACVSFQMWGFTDKYSWVPGWFPGEGQALIFDESYNPKPAYYGLYSRLAEWATREASAVASSRDAALRDRYGIESFH